MGDAYKEHLEEEGIDKDVQKVIDEIEKDAAQDDDELDTYMQQKIKTSQQTAEEADNNKEKTKELCLANDGTYDGKCEFKDDDGTAEQDQVNFEHSLADRGLWEEYDKNYNGADWEYDEADA